MWVGQAARLPKLIVSTVVSLLIVPLKRGTTLPWSSLCEAYWQKVVSVCYSSINYFYQLPYLPRRPLQRGTTPPTPPPAGDNWHNSESLLWYFSYTPASGGQPNVQTPGTGGPPVL